MNEQERQNTVRQKNRCSITIRSKTVTFSHDALVNMDAYNAPCLKMEFFIDRKKQVAAFRFGPDGTELKPAGPESIPSRICRKALVDLLREVGNLPNEDIRIFGKVEDGFLMIDLVNGNRQSCPRRAKQALK